MESPEQLKSKIAQLESEKSNLVDELKGDRSKNRDALTAKESEIEDLKVLLTQAIEKNNSAPTEDEKIANVVRAVLNEGKQEDAAKNKKAAFDKFVAEHTEYHPDNDAGGLKLKALEKEFSSFNTTGIVSIDDFVAVVGKAERLLRDTDTSRQTETITVPSTPAPSVAPRSTVVDKISPSERAVIERNGWTEERYLKLKDSNPDLVASLVAPAPAQ
jgi:hypothetical protein